MLEIKNIKKIYKTGDFTQVALNNVSIKFRKNEFVTILGQSGSGKTTMLNILGGLDKYNSGDLIINGKSTKRFKDKDWDAYRNKSIGFIFQSYNLINHISVLKNVEMALKLNNVSRKKRHKLALETLEKVGLKEHIKKKPTELSGGQMQRVAIARSLVNNPDIILADEPTGALDSKTSVQIMDIIKEISKEKLVIMVSHNKELANLYSTRIIELKDGNIVSDNNPVTNDEEIITNYKLNKTKMSFKEALFLSFNNIKTKKGRTFLTAFASSIGIIGIALILSLSNGFDKQIEKYEKGILSAMPVSVSSDSVKMDEETIGKLSGKDQKKYPDYNYVISKKNNEELITRKNNITEDYIKYIEKIPKEYSYGTSYLRYTNINFIQKINGKSTLIDNKLINTISIPKSINNKMFLNVYYDILDGKLPENKNEIVLFVDSNNNVDENILESLGFEKKQKVTFKSILNSNIRVVMNDDLYKNSNGYFKLNTNYENMYENASELKVVGILRMKKDYPSYITSSALGYTDEFIEYYIDINNESKIVSVQKKIDFNILTGMTFDNSNLTKEKMISYLGGESIPYALMLYPKDFKSKDNLLNYLDKYNKGKKDKDKIFYTDQAKMISNMSGSIMNAVTIVLIAFSSISLIVSSIMIGIITYISVLERTKEIGILRSIGARKKDITRVFNAETFIIGITSGLIGVTMAYLLTIPANNVIYKLTDLSKVAVLNPIHSIILIMISMTLTMIGGYIPAKIASRKDPVIALRSE